jgi:hypothetical protein
MAFGKAPASRTSVSNKDNLVLDIAKDKTCPYVHFKGNPIIVKEIFKIPFNAYQFFNFLKSQLLKI